jgi:hypothetical protein
MAFGVRDSADTDVAGRHRDSSLPERILLLIVPAMRVMPASDASNICCIL